MSDKLELVADFISLKLSTNNFSDKLKFVGQSSIT